ncbi:MAG: glycosyltransferase [Cuniculiplasma sp.]
MKIEFLILIILTVFSSVISVIYYMVNVYLSRKREKIRFESERLTSGDATVVITVYREPVDHLKRAISSVRDQVKEIIVVGDGVKDPYESLCREENVIFVSNSTRSGKRKSMALGVSLVRTKIVFFMDGDMIPEGDAISKILKEYSPEIGGVGGNINFDTSGGNFTSYASQFIERSKEIIQRSMKPFGSVMLIDGGFGSYRMSLVGNYIQSPEFHDFRIEGKIPYYGGGDDADLTSYIIKRGYVATKAFDARVTTIPKENIKAYFKQSVRWSRTGWRTFVNNIRNGTMKKANVFYRIEQTLTYVLPVVFFAVILLRGTIFLEILARRGFFPALISMIGLHFHYHIDLYETLYRLSTTSSAIASLVFAGSVARRTVKDRLKTIAYGSIGAALLFLATIYAMFTMNRA